MSAPPRTLLRGWPQPTGSARGWESPPAAGLTTHGDRMEAKVDDENVKASAEWLHAHQESAESWRSAEALAAFEAWVPRRLTYNEALREHLYRAFCAGRASVKGAE